MRTTSSRSNCASRSRPATAFDVAALHHQGGLAQGGDLLAARVQVRGQVVHAARVEDELVGVGRVGDEHGAGAAAAVLPAEHDVDLVVLEQPAGEVLQLLHASTSAASRLGGSVGAPAGRLRPLVELDALGRQRAIGREGPELARLGHGLVDHVAPLGALAGRHPAEGHATLVDAEEVHDVVEHGEAPPGVVVARGVVAVGGVTAAHDHAVGAALEGLDDEQRVDAPRAGQPDDAHVAGHVQAARAGQVGARVGAPVADEGGDARLEFGGFAAAAPRCCRRHVARVAHLTPRRTGR